MKSLARRNFIAIWAFVLVVAMGAGFSALGQGNGHGNGHGHDKGGGNDHSSERENGHQQDENHGQQKREVQHERRIDRQEPQPNFERHDRQYDRRQEVRNDHVRHNNGERDRGFIQHRDPQYDRRPDFDRIEQYPRYRIDQGRGNGNSKHRDTREDHNFYGSPNWDHSSPNNYGYERSREVHERNAARKALRNQPRVDDGYDERNYPFIGNDGDRRDSRRDNLLRSVISRVFGNNSNGDDYASQDDRFNYGIPYNQTRRDYYPRDQSYGGSTPYYDNYQSYNNSYSPNENGFGNDIGLPFLSNSSSGGGFISRLFSKLLAFGYNQGFNDARSARSNGFDNRSYQDPYSDQDTAYQEVGYDYDPYSSLGENRQYVSEGYELGYQDALNSRAQDNPLSNVESGGDLISLLLGSVLQRFN